MKRALLDNVDLQARLADNINRVILNKEPAIETPAKAVPETSVVSSASLADVTKALDEVIPTIVERTEADPVFERFLEEFFLCKLFFESRSGFIRARVWSVYCFAFQRARRITPEEPLLLSEYVCFRWYVLFSTRINCCCVCRENGSKSGKKKNTKATGGRDGDSCKYFLRQTRRPYIATIFL